MRLDRYRQITAEEGWLKTTLESYVSTMVTKKYRLAVEQGVIPRNLNKEQMTSVVSQLTQSFIQEVLPDNVTNADIPFMLNQ